MLYGLPPFFGRLSLVTIPPEERTENLSLALALLLERVGDEAVNDSLYDPSEFNDILSTTWEELKLKGFVEVMPAGPLLCMTGRGWVAALLTTNKISSAQFSDRSGRLFASMKKHVKGRKDAQCVPIKSLASESEVPPGWAFNIIEGRFMEEIQKRKGASWVKQGSIVLIPAGFGMEPTDLETLLNSELARKVGDLQDQLAEYTCPICGEGLSSAGPIQLSEDSDGYYQSFGCGYAAIDGHPESLCPSDPLFPKIRDFDLQVSKIDPQRQVYRAGAEWVVLQSREHLMRVKRICIQKLAHRQKKPNSGSLTAYSGWLVPGLNERAVRINS
jgi:hypothetical protein